MKHFSLNNKNRGTLCQVESQDGGFKIHLEKSEHSNLWFAPYIQLMRNLN